MAYGEIADVPKGTIFHNRQALFRSGIYRDIQRGITGRRNELGGLPESVADDVGWESISVIAGRLAPHRVLAPFAVDQAADLCSCGHENDDSAAGLVCMSWTAPGTRTTATWNA